nr:hypothetical protein [Bacteroidota bacterium]
MNETENKRDTYNVEKMYQINQQQAESIHSNQSLEINQNGNNKEKKKPFWRKAWIVISAI